MSYFESTHIIFEENPRYAMRTSVMVNLPAKLTNGILICLVGPETGFHNRRHDMEEVVINHVICELRRIIAIIMHILYAS